MDRLKMEYEGGFERMEGKMAERDTRMLVALVAIASACVTILCLVFAVLHFAGQRRLMSPAVRLRSADRSGWRASCFDTGGEIVADRDLATPTTGCRFAVHCAGAQPVRDCLHNRLGCVGDPDVPRLADLVRQFVPA